MSEITDFCVHKTKKILMLFYAESENVLNNYSEIIDGMVMKNYSKNRKRPQVYNDIERAKENDKNKDEITPKDI